MVRRSSSFNTERLDRIYQDPHVADYRLRLVYGDLDDASSLNRALRSVKPDEIYNLGAQSHVRVSFDVPEYTADVSGLGCVRLLEAIRESDLDCRFYQASSSELYGKVVETPQRETTPFYPRSPYACAKAYAYYITVNYRESYGMHASNGILFNHESPRRGETSSLARSPARPLASSMACRTSSSSATSTPVATGVSPATTSRACGSCSSKAHPTTMSWPPARPTPSASS